MILSILPPSSIMNFFRSSKQAFRYANAVLDQGLLQFHRYTTASSGISYKQTLILTLLFEFPYPHCLALDRRWELTSKVVFLAKYASKIPEQLIAPTMDMRAPLRSINHSFGFKELIAEIPDDINAIRVYMVELGGNLYVSGLKFIAKTTRRLLGNQSEIFHDLDGLHLEVDTIRFVVDSLGLRSLKLGDSLWSSGHPRGCWEGFSKRQGDRMVRIVHDVSLQARMFRGY